VGDGAALASTILELAAKPDLCHRMGQRARQAFDAEFDKEIALTRWEELLLKYSGASLADAAFHGPRRGELTAWLSRRDRRCQP
jgi:hypothetical protein